jgi:hypothetical protein
MILFEKTGDILSVVGKEYVVHTVSGDYVLGAGIAKKINEMMDMSKQLHFHYDSSVNSYVKNAYKIDNNKPKNGEISLFPAEDFGSEIKEEIKEKSLKEKVLELYFKGLDVYLIAENLDSSVAEVQTIINLFGK